MTTAKGKYTVYLVDDDPFYLSTIEQTIRTNTNFEVLVKSFTTGEACLNEIATAPPDIVVLDYYLNSQGPDAMNGVQLLRKIKAMNNKIQAIMLSGQESIEVAVNSIKNGAYDYVVKSENAFVRMNNALRNIASFLHMGKEMKTYERWNLFFAFLLVVLVMGLAYWSILHF